MSSLFYFAGTLSILSGLGGLFAGGTINFLVLSRPSRTPFACQRGRNFKNGGDNWLGQDMFCLPGPGRRYCV